jgi:hypothetical protein
MKSLLLVMALSAVLPPAAMAQSFCASDAQATPIALLERFISADCEACWRAQPPDSPAAQTLALDWIVPGQQGDEAPLSAAANRDALMRLDSLGRAAPSTMTSILTRVGQQRAHHLRVAHGLALGGYIGASIEFKTAVMPRHPERLSAWLVLIETIPAGTEGTPFARNIVRNVYKPTWNKREQLLKTERIIFRDMRPLNIPEGAAPERLRVVGWVQDARGRVLTAAQSVCVPPEPSLSE